MMRKIKGLLIGGLIAMVALIYCVSPIDLMPGPIDDIVVILLGAGAAIAKIKE